MPRIKGDAVPLPAGWALISYAASKACTIPYISTHNVIQSLIPKKCSINDNIFGFEG